MKKLRKTFFISQKSVDTVDKEQKELKKKAPQGKKDIKKSEALEKIISAYTPNTW